MFVPSLVPCRPRHIGVALYTFVAVSVLPGCRPSAPAAPAEVPPDTWAVVDGRNVGRDAVESAFRRTRDAAQPLSAEEELTAKLSLLNDLILQELLLAKARELKVELSDTEVDNAFAEAKSNMSEQAFQEELARRKVTAADMRESLRRELLTQKVIQQEVSSKVSVADQEVTAFFNANRAQFNIPEEAYHIAQIVVTPVQDPQVGNRTGDDATTPQLAAAKAKMLMEKLQSGTPFPDLAMDYSEDPETAPRGGDLGFVPVSRLKQAPPLLRDAVLKGKPGSATLVSQGGAHSIVLVVAHEQAGQRDLSTPGVRERITDTLRSRKEQVLRAAYLTALRTDADITNYLARRVIQANGKLPDGAAAPATGQ
jgi:peptidyl-prolyl cis-trans isomerase SurA